MTEHIHIHIDFTGETRNPLGSIANLNMLVGVGFGTAIVTKDGELIFDENNEDKYSQHLDEDGFASLKTFKALAKQSPNSNWLCTMFAPLWNATWQRQGDDKWVCIETGEGFA